MRMILLTFLILSACAPQDAESFEAIHLNQIGFYPNAPKRAVVSGIVDDHVSFQVLNQESGDLVYSGELSPERRSDFSPRRTRIADFSALTDTGVFAIRVEGLDTSATFAVRPNVLNGIAKASIKAFYYQRASRELPEKYAGQWARDSGHPDTMVFIHPSAATESRGSDSRISSPGGWYDAGDYNKYVVNSGITTGTLLSLYEDFPKHMAQVGLTIPESDNELPDLLDEILWNLRWMMTMQDPNDGGVYNKVTTANFEGMIMPHQGRAQRYVVRKGTAATLDFVAVSAQASRVFRMYEDDFQGFADSLLSASKKAWQWAIENPDVSYDQDEMNKKFEPQVLTGGYGDKDFSDEFIWAAAELTVTTGDETYYTSTNMYPDAKMPIPNWGNVRLLGYYTLLKYRSDLPVEVRKDLPSLKNRMVALGEELRDGLNSNSYHTVMGKSAEDFNWGSNSKAANQGVALIQLYHLTNDRKYLEGALTNLDYLLGRNATGYCFVTGFGIKSPMHPHHRPSEADGIEAPVPGFLVGGPNGRMQDDCTYVSELPDEAYTDQTCSYASNEVAINWNAPLAYLLNATEALQRDFTND